MTVFGMTPIRLCRRNAIPGFYLPLAINLCPFSRLYVTQVVRPAPCRLEASLLAWLVPVLTPLLVSTSSPAFASPADRQAVVDLVNL